MGCSSGGCSSGGCGSGGGCSSDGCNKKNVFDWFANIQYAVGADEFPIVEISFKHGTRKEYFFNDKKIALQKHDAVCVEGNGGYDIGQVSLSGELVKIQLKKNKQTKPTYEEYPKILRLANEKELKIQEEYRAKENQMMIKARELARNLKLEMKISEVEFQADGKKATFFFIADERVDFRELIKLYIAEFKIRIEMRHIGARQEAGRIGGIGSCGRELCCSTWLSDFPSVTTQAARYQNISLNLEKLSGQCGRLKCCLNYELSQYIEATKAIPQKVNVLETEEGVAVLRKTEVLKRIMCFSYKEDDTGHIYKLPIENVLKIKAMNEQGKKPENLVSLAIKESVNVEKIKDEDLVGQVQLKNLEKKTNNKKRKKKKKNPNASTNDSPNANNIQNNVKKN
jgi:cell fate regulator YaaT (PSP1 superfamily)